VYSENVVKEIVSRDFVVCFLVSFNRSDISTHQEHDGAMTVAADRLGAQLHSQCKLTTPRHENRKILHENERKEPAPDV
jgi:hypothetical protein